MSLISQLKDRAKRLFDRIRSDQLKTNLLQAIPFWVASIFTGLLAVLYTRLFVFAEQGTHYIFKHNAWLLFIITPACFVFAWWVVKQFSPYARGSGIPQVMASVELANPKDDKKVNKLLSFRIIIVKIISSLVMIFGGGVIGREGPTIQIAGSVFRKVNEWLPGWWPKISKRNMIMTGAAGGLAAAFNTPLGGIVFAVEELTKTHISYFKTALFTAIIIAGLTAQALLGPYLYLGYPDVSNLSKYIFFVVMGVAIISGLLGSLMSKLIMALFKWKSKFKFNYQHIIYLVVCALIIVCVAYFFDDIILGSGKEIMTQKLFTPEKYSDWHEPGLRMAGPVLSFTSGASGGIFAPSLSAGASIGSAFAGFMKLSAADSNIIILSGMVGFLTGVTRTPFTSAILVLEMTDRHRLIFHLMAAGMIANIVALFIDRYSFYDHMRNEYLKEIHNEDEHIEATEKKGK